MQGAAAVGLVRPCAARPLAASPSRRVPGAGLSLPARGLGLSVAAALPRAGLTAAYPRRVAGLVPTSPLEEKRPVATAATATAAEGSTGGEEKSGGLVKTLQLGALFGLWYLFNFNIYNKQVLKALPYPINITTVQFAVGTTIALFMWITGILKRPKISGAQLLAILSLAIVHTMGNLFTNMSLGKVAVSFTHTIKAMEPFFPVLLSAIFLGELPTPWVVMSLVPIVGGVALTSLTEASFNCSTSADVCTTFDGTKSVSSEAAEEKVGVLLLNLGGPETLDDVQPFLFNLFADPDIIRLPRLFRFLQKPLAKLISMFRAPKSKEGYASIGGGSPLRKITDEQANALKIALEKKNLHANIYVGMRYWYPFTEEAIDQIKKDRVTKLVVLPLYPQYSISTSGSSIRVLQDIVKEDSYFSGLPISIIESWYQRDGYVKSMADLIEKELSIFSNPEEVMIFFSAHGVPLTYVEDAGDPYRDQMEECIALIMGELKSRGILNSHTLAYQSRVGPVQWLKPYTDEVLVELGQKGVKSLLAVPVSFVSEHIETLEEIDMEYKELALESGIENWGRVPALGCTSSFISDLADAVVEALPSASALVTKKPDDNDSDMDFMHYLTKMFFGSVLAFILLLSPRLISAFRNTLL